MRKTQFPRLVIPMATVVTGIFNLGVNLVAVFVFLLAYGVTPTWTWFELPLIVGALLVLTAATSTLLSCLYVRFRDVAIIWGVAVTALYFGSPVLYPFQIVPEQYRALLAVNPLTPIFAQARKAIIDPSAPGAVETVGGWPQMIPPVLISVALCLSPSGTSIARRRGWPRSSEAGRLRRGRNLGIRGERPRSPPTGREQLRRSPREDPIAEEELSVEGLAVPEQPAAAAPEQPREPGEPVVRGQQPPKGQAFRPVDPRPAAEREDLTEDEQLEPVVVVDRGSPVAQAHEALPHMLSDRAGRTIGLRVADHGALVLHIVVERPVDVGDFASAERNQSQPVVVEGTVMRGRERQGIVEQLSAEEHRCAGDRVGDREGGEIRVVVLPDPPVRGLDHAPVGPDHAGVAIDESACPIAAISRSSLSGRQRSS